MSKKKINKIVDVEKAMKDLIIYNKGWNEALNVAYNIACVVDSKRGNEILIAQIIYSRKVQSLTGDEND